MSSSGEDLIVISSSSSFSSESLETLSSSEEDEFIFLLELGKDLMGLIFKELQYGEIVRLYSICKRFVEKLVDYQKFFKYRLTKQFKLKTQQLVLRHKFLAVEECFSFRAEIGYGKTIAGYACCTKFSLIVCPGNTLKVWADEAKKIGWYNPNPKRSRIVCFSSKFKKHSDYLRTFVDKGRKRKRMIIVTFDKNALVAANILLHIGVPATLIIDEAHINRDVVCNLQHMCKWNLLSGYLFNSGYTFNRELLLSSSDMIPFEIGFEEEWIHRKISVLINNDLPKVIWEIEVLDESPDLLSYDRREMIVAERIVKLAEHNSKIVVVTNIPYIHMASLLSRRLKVFDSPYSITIVSKFNEYKGKACMMIEGYRVPDTSVELDMNANAIVIMHPSVMSVNKCKQIMNKVVKPCNPNKNIKIYLLDDEKDALHCSYIYYFLHQHWIWNCEPLPHHGHLKKSYSIMKILDSTHNVISQTDGCIIFNDYAKIPIHPDTLINWWNTYKTPDTILTEVLIRDLC